MYHPQSKYKNRGNASNLVQSHFGSPQWRRLESGIAPLVPRGFDPAFWCLKHPPPSPLRVRFATPFCFFQRKQFCDRLVTDLFHPCERYVSGSAVCAGVLQAPLTVSRRPCTGAQSVREVSYLYEWSAAQSTAGV